MKMTVVTVPGATPVTLDAVKGRLLIDHADDDADLALLLAAAVERVEGDTLRPMVTRTIAFACPGFWPAMVFPVHPVGPIASIVYRDAAGIERVLDATAYRLDRGGDRGPAVLRPAPGTAWPAVHPGEVDPVTITALVGRDPAAVPAVQKLAVMTLVAEWYRNREVNSVGTLAHPLSDNYQGLVGPERLVP